MRSVSMIFGSALWLCSLNALAQPQQTPAQQPQQPQQPAQPGATRPRPAATPGRAAIARAQQAYVDRNYAQALTAFRDVQSSAPEYSEALLGVGYTQAAQGNREAAIASFREAIQAATAHNDDAVRARALMAIANNQEYAHRWSDAITAWQEFVSFAEGHSQVADAATGRARVEAIRQREQDETRWAQVRQRIEERRRVNARPQQNQ